jgi:predicted nucleic acid-binding protein
MSNVLSAATDRRAARTVRPDVRDNLIASDATHVALAESLACELLTADRRLAAAPGPACPIVIVRR